MDLKLAMYSPYDSDIQKVFQTVLMIVTVRITIMDLKLAMYGTYNRDIQKNFKPVLIIETVLTLGRKNIRTIAAFYSKLDIFGGLKNYLNVV